MPAGKLIFSQLTDWIHSEQFRRCVNRYDGNRKVYGFPCWDQFLAMTFAQITYRDSLADFDVRQAFSISELREGHGQELIPTRKAMNLVVASVAIDAAAKLFGMNPVGQLRKNQFSGGHNASLAA